VNSSNNKQTQIAVIDFFLPSHKHEQNGGYRTNNQFQSLVILKANQGAIIKPTLQSKGCSLYKEVLP
jgi:hypothetical protein